MASLSGLQRRWNKRRFDSAIRAVRQTPPLHIRRAPLVLFSMCSHADADMYLLAVKSIYSRIGEGTIAILNDGSLTDEDKAMFRHHLGDPDIYHIADVDTSPAPKRGCWERLFKLLELTPERYVIQIDSDLLAVGALDEVIDCYRRNVSFTQSGGPGQCPVKTLAQTSEGEAGWADGGQHVQQLAEMALGKMRNPRERRYIRGCAGFAGFAIGPNLSDLARDFSSEMEALIGRAKWSEWGSEQVASNFVVANTPDAHVLDITRYPIHWADTDLSSARLVHFVGPYRYSFGTYRRLAQDEIQRLNAA